MKKITAMIALAIIFNVNAQVYNTSYGEFSLIYNTQGNYNSAFGYRALLLNTQGSSNSGFGEDALKENTTGNRNSAFGEEALTRNKTGNHNSAFGVNALIYNTQGSYNTAFGYGALDSITIGKYNTGLGYEPKVSKEDAINQTVIGYKATGQSDNSVTLGNSAVTAVYMGEDSGATVHAKKLNIDNAEYTTEDLNGLSSRLTADGKGYGFRLSASTYKNKKSPYEFNEYSDENYGYIGNKAVDLSFSRSYQNDTNGATGEHSLATGLNTTASGAHSTAMGLETTASGNYSTAMGYETTASDHSSFVIGRYNNALSEVTTDGSANKYNANNTAFVIGNGITPHNKSDAFKVLFNGDATIGKNLTIKGKLIIDEKELSSDKIDELNRGILSSVKENNIEGFRLSAYPDTNYGNIGEKAVDLSYSDTKSTTQGAMGKHSLATGLNTTASESYSTAMGLNTTASESYSTAMGYETKANGEGSTAMGKQTTASGESSTAMGKHTTASGAHSTAMGNNTTASDHGSFVIGQYNDALSEVTTDGSAELYNANNTAFVIGNGTPDNKSDAFKVLFNGDATIGNDLSINGKLIIDKKEITFDKMNKLDKLDGGILSSVEENNIEGFRLSAYPDTNYGNIGEKAVDLSYSKTESDTNGASGENSTAIGRNTTASGFISTAMGRHTKASGTYSTTMGDLTEASGESSTAMGAGSKANGLFSTAMGYYTKATGIYSTAMGLNTTASGYGSTAMGLETEATGLSSTAMGYNTTASDHGSFVIGQYNDALSEVTTDGSAELYNANNTAFVIGNGFVETSNIDRSETIIRSDAFKVLFNGDATIGKDLTIKGKLIIDGKELSSDKIDELNRGILSSVTENNNTGFRLSTYSDTNYGDIGDKAIDLSHSDTESTTQGAMGKHSLATGLNTTASGEHSTAMGYNTTASDHGSFVIGQYNDALSLVTTDGSADQYNANNTAFVIGNGTAPDNKSDAFKVAYNGDATISKDLTIKGKLIIDEKELNSDKIDELNRGILSSVTENNNTGFRLSAYSDTNYGNIGDKAIDLSHSDTESTTQGAMGKHSLATGFRTTASGEHSTASGYMSTASGRGSTAIGNNTTASDYGSFVIGQYNHALSSVTTNGGATAYNADNTAFVIGNGTAPDNKSDAFKVLFNGDATIGKDLSINGKLIIDGKELKLSSDKIDKLNGGILSSVKENNIEGFRLSAYPDTNYGNIGEKAVDLSYSDTKSNTQGAMGKHSLATGLNTTASESYSTAMGLNTTASESYSTAMGYETKANGEGSTAMGKQTTASGESSTAMGKLTTASGYFSTASGENSTASGRSSTASGAHSTASGKYSTAMGNNTTASGKYSLATGNNTTASGKYSLSTGNNTTASGEHSTAGGYMSTASGNYSTAMGYETTASDHGSLVIGQYNEALSSVTSNGSATAYNANNTAFVIGNGTSFNKKSDAFKVLFNGDATVSNNLTVTGDIHVSSDARLKANIVSLGSTLAKLLLIDGKTFTMKKNGKQKIGVLAQNIQEVFPELVSKDDNKMLAVNYQGLVPVLINALKEQDAKMKKQDAKMKKQDAKISRLEGLVEKLITDK